MDKDLEFKLLGIAKAIKVIEEQQKTIRKLIENQPQSIMLTRD